MAELYDLLSELDEEYAVYTVTEENGRTIVTIFNQAPMTFNDVHIIVEGYQGVKLTFNAEGEYSSHQLIA